MKYLLLALMFAGCAQNEGSKPAADKSVFSIWQKEGISLDFRGGAFSTSFKITMLMKAGGQCLCDVIFVGNESSGSSQITSCEAISGADCSSFKNRPNTYNKENNQITFCTVDKSSCATYN
jgi:hypothetical protein